MKTLQQRFSDVQQRIRDAATDCGRNPDAIQLLAVSKTRSADDILALSALGQSCFGENYIQEAVNKINITHEHRFEWHFIGPVQSNKTRAIAENFHWLHSLDRLKIAERINAQRPAGLDPLNVCLQINISAEPAKAGVKPQDAESLCADIKGLANLRLRGLMALPLATDNYEAQRSAFRQLRELSETLNQNGYPLDCLSMGMSGDLEAAIAEGATIVRIGTDLFGSRQ